MKPVSFLALALCGLPPMTAIQGSAPPRILKRSDVAFMYQADRKTYAEYGATVLAWGGRPTSKSLADAEGVTFFGSVGMVTEFARYYERFPKTYEQGLCRDVHGQPVKVPWLTDHQHKGIPFWWCCTRQPMFRRYLEERVTQTVQAGADGVHIDDHMGSAGGLWLGLCFCDRCVSGFRDYLQSLPAEKQRRLAIGNPQQFNYRDTLKQWLAAQKDPPRRFTSHPLWEEWTIYQCRASAAFMQHLRELAAKTAGRTVPIGANAGLLWPRHLCDYKALDLFSAETDHEAATKRFSDLPLVAYRMADALQRPYAATASGGDWAFIKEHNLPGLVQGWIALSYAAGHCLMAPHRQWCYTPQKGTHWYQGPAEKFAPLYRFVCHHTALFDDYENHADLAIVLPHRAYAKNPRQWFEICQQLAAANLSFRILLAGDEIVDHPLTAGAFQSCPALLIPGQDALLSEDRQLLAAQTSGRRVFHSVPEALDQVQPTVRVQAEGIVRALPRIKPGSAVIHLLNYQYEARRDQVTPVQEVTVQANLRALGVAEAVECRFYAPGADPVGLPVEQGRITVPQLGLWGIIALEEQ